MILKLSKRVEVSRVHEADDVSVRELRSALLKWKYLTLIFGLCFAVSAIGNVILVSLGFLDQTLKGPGPTRSEVLPESYEQQKREILIISTLKLPNCIQDLARDENEHDKNDVIPNFSPQPPEEGDSDLGHDIHIIRRSRWGGRPILDGYQNRTLVHPIQLVIIGHTGGRQCMTVETCSSTLQSIQVMHVRRGWVDVAFNFLIGGDGNVYDALAWNIRNYVRNNSIMISFFGNYEYDVVEDRQKMALELLLNQGVKLGKLVPNYLLAAHNQVANTLSPGTNLLEVIQQLPHYYNGTFT